MGVILGIIILLLILEVAILVEDNCVDIGKSLVVAVKVGEATLLLKTADEVINALSLEVDIETTSVVLDTISVVALLLSTVAVSTLLSKTVVVGVLPSTIAVVVVLASPAVVSSSLSLVVDDDPIL